MNKSIACFLVFPVLSDPPYEILVVLRKSWCKLWAVLEFGNHSVVKWWKGLPGVACWTWNLHYLKLTSNQVSLASRFVGRVGFGAMLDTACMQCEHFSIINTLLSIFQWRGYKRGREWWRWAGPRLEAPRLRAYPETCCTDWVLPLWREPGERRFSAETCQKKQNGICQC